MSERNAMRWSGETGHYEVWYVSLTDRGSGLGAWARLTMRAPVSGPPECSIWFMAMGAEGRTYARKSTLPISELRAEADPFRLVVGDCELSARRCARQGDDAGWELGWEPATTPGEIVHPLLERARIARTMMVMPHP